MKIKCLLWLLLLSQIGWSQGTEKGQSILAACIEAHGGLEKWNSFGTLSYKITSGGKTSQQIIDLRNRNTWHQNDLNTFGYNGTQAWYLGNIENVPAKSVTFYHNIDFYFFAIPFVLADPGVYASYEGEKALNGKMYDVVKASFGEGVGVAPKDIYILYIDKETQLLHALLYTVTFFNTESERLSAKVYEAYTEIKGLQVPIRMENYKWENGTLGEPANRVRSFAQIRFKKKQPKSDLFDPPTGARIEE